jgi:hypothetical protein
VGGHSLWFRLFFATFLPIKTDHPCTKKKMVNGLKPPPPTHPHPTPLLPPGHAHTRSRAYTRAHTHTHALARTHTRAACPGRDHVTIIGRYSMHACTAHALLCARLAVGSLADQLGDVVGLCIGGAVAFKLCKADLNGKARQAVRLITLGALVWTSSIPLTDVKRVYRTSRRNWDAVSRFGARRFFIQKDSLRILYGGFMK